MGVQYNVQAESRKRIVAGVEGVDAVLAWQERWFCGSVSHITLELRWILVVPLCIETCSPNVVTMDLKDLTRSDGETISGQEQDTDMIYSEIMNQRSGFRIPRAFR